ncbi:GNAT family N-acetyltransferase [Streptomyces sp. H27-D2]|uniref:GNAT family N-acetyltransferase n=1 Tax=Streptomyces sp. H27-D2 TaxID=3046304 RepID=UPI002DB58366|nr:GNAT family N-acetyltransferase [Streptomyces sp. H27-D2]MEC4021001.1 GNAT family N-acetyltransferase [Streptomyces sp. H27-D2]
MMMPLGSPPTAAEIDAWCAVLAETHAHDLPPTVPGPERASTAGELRIAGLGSRHLHLGVRLPDGRPGYAGVASLRLYDDPENAKTAFVDTLAVRPGQRRQGIGARLWEALQAVLVTEGRSSASVMLEGGGAGEAFARARGFDRVLPLNYYVQDVAEADTAPVDTAPGGAPGVPHAEGARGRLRLPDGYRFAEWTGIAPDEHAAAFAAAHQSMEDAPSGDFEVRPPRWDAERVRAAARVPVERGGVMLAVSALAADGTVAGYTELVLPTPESARAVQYDTVVLPNHRGHGLGRVVKQRMLEVLRERHPAVREIATTVADDNAPMIAVNAALGYRPERPAAVYQIRL